MQSPKSNRAPHTDAEEPLSHGRVVANYGKRLLVEDESGARRPAFVGRRGLKIVCGDRVRWREPADGGGDVAVLELMPRDTELSRPDSSGRPEILAANIDQVVVICAPEPPPDPFIIDRYLAAAEIMGAAALVACNKSDLPGADAVPLVEFEAVGYPALRVSAHEAHGLDALRGALAGHSSILVGQSGVGKSSLLNALLPGTDVATAQVSTATGEGRHRTTATTLYPLPGGGVLLDSPGVRDFAPALHDPRLAAAGFREIVGAANHCRFADCRHMREPGCAVKDGVEAGTISARRYESYRRLLRLTEDLQR